MPSGNAHIQEQPAMHSMDHAYTRNQSISINRDGHNAASYNNPLPHMPSSHSLNNNNLNGQLGNHHTNNSQNYMQTHQSSSTSYSGSVICPNSSSNSDNCHVAVNNAVSSGSLTHVSESPLSTINKTVSQMNRYD